MKRSQAEINELLRYVEELRAREKAAKQPSDAANSYVRELRQRVQFCSKRYSKLAGQYLKMKGRLRSISPKDAREFLDPCQLL